VPLDPVSQGLFWGNVVGSVVSTLSRVFYEIPVTTKAQHLQHQERLSFDRERFEWEKRQAIENAQADRERALQLRAERLEEIARSAEIKFILDSWPLKLAPSVMLRDSRSRQVPYVLLSLPESMANRRAVEEDVRTFLDRFYAFGGTERPVEFLGAAWDPTKVRGAEGVKQLATILSTEPTILIEVEELGESLKLRLGIWGNGIDNYIYRTAATVPLKATGGEEDGALLTSCTCLLAGLFADDFYRRYYNVRPQLPEALRSLSLESTLPSSTLAPMLADAYKSMYRHVAAQQPLLEPEISLDLARLLLSIGEHAQAREALRMSVTSWAGLRGERVTDIPAGIDLLIRAATQRDAAFLHSIRDILAGLGEAAFALQIDDRVAGWPPPDVSVETSLPPPNERVSDAIWNPHQRQKKSTSIVKPPKKNPFS